MSRNNSWSMKAARTCSGKSSDVAQARKPANVRALEGTRTLRRSGSGAGGVEEARFGWCFVVEIIGSLERGHENSNLLLLSCGKEEETARGVIRGQMPNARSRHFAEDQGGVAAAETEGVGEHHPDGLRASLSGDMTEITG